MSNTQITIKKASRIDTPVILSFIQALSRYEKMEDRVKVTQETLEVGLFDHEYAEVLLAYYDDKPVGFALFYKTYSTFSGKANLYLEDLYVDESLRGQGVGTRLLKELAIITASRGYGRMEWSCLTWNTPSVDFYLRLGASIVDEWHHFKLDGEHLKRFITK